MDRFNKYLAATFLSAAMLFAGAAQAMEIQQYDKMAIPNQVAYDRLLEDGAKRVLQDEGRPDLAAQVDRLFTTILPGDQHPIGVVEFERNLARLRVADVGNAQKNPKDPRIEVEDAMFVTLQKNHIDLPDSFVTVASNFQPKYPRSSRINSVAYTRAAGLTE